YSSINASSSHDTTLEHTLSDQRMWTGPRHLPGQIFSAERLGGCSPVREVQCAILRRAADPLAQRLIAAFDKHLFDLPDEIGIPSNLDAALLLLHDHDAARFFLFRNLVLHGEGGGIGAWRILEAEQGIVLHVIQQAK